jgi:hypothetical protein
MRQPLRRAENCPLYPERSLFEALGRFFIENGAQTVTIKPQAKAMLHSKSCDFWFALIPVVGPNPAEFFFVNSAVFRRLELALDLLQ